MDIVSIQQAVLQAVSKANQGTAQIVSDLGGAQFNVKAFGAVGDGVTDDTDAIQDAILAAQTAGVGTVYAPTGTYCISAPIQFADLNGNCINLMGASGNAEPHQGTTFKATTTTACLMWGEIGAPNETGQLWGRCGLNGNFTFDGNLVATAGIINGTLAAAYGHFTNIKVKRVNGDGWVCEGQNMYYTMCESSDNAGNGWLIDHGPQGLQFNSCYGAFNGEYNVKIQQSDAVGITVEPMGIDFFQCMFEQDGGTPPGTNSFSSPGLGALFISAATEVRFTSCDFISAHDVITISKFGSYSMYVQPTYIRFINCRTEGVEDGTYSALLLDALNAGVAEAFFGTNYGSVIVDGGWIKGQIKNQSSSPIIVRNMNEGYWPTYTYVTEGTDAYPGLETVVTARAGHPNRTPSVIVAADSQALDLLSVQKLDNTQLARITAAGAYVASANSAGPVTVGYQYGVPMVQFGTGQTYIGSLEDNNLYLHGHVSVETSETDKSPLVVSVAGAESTVDLLVIAANSDVKAKVTKDGDAVFREGDTTNQVKLGSVGFGVAGIEMANDTSLTRVSAGQNYHYGTLLVQTQAADAIVLQARGVASQTANLIEAQDAAGAGLWAVDRSGVPRWIATGNEQTTVGAAGAASALPATPTKYLKVVDSSGAVLVIPAYAAT